MPSIASSAALAAARREREHQFVQDTRHSPEEWRHIEAPAPLSRAKVQREWCDVHLLRLRGPQALRRRAAALTVEVRVGVRAVKSAYGHHLYEIIRLGQGLKRPVHSLRDTTLALNPQAPAPPRASQFRNMSWAAQTPDANKADEIRAWVECVDDWLIARGLDEQRGHPDAHHDGQGEG